MALLFSSISLSGYPPFMDDHKGMTIYEQILQGQYSFPDRYWAAVSNEGEHRYPNLWLTSFFTDILHMQVTFRHDFIDLLLFEIYLHNWLQRGIVFICFTVNLWHETYDFMPWQLRFLSFPKRCAIKVFPNVISIIKSTAKDLIRRLLTVEESERISVDDALNHPWLQVKVNFYLFTDYESSSIIPFFESAKQMLLCLFLFRFLYIYTI